MDELHHDLPFLLERMETEKVENLATKVHDKTECVIHIRNLKASIKSRINFEEIS